MNIIARIKGLYRRLFGRTKPRPTLPTNPMKADTPGSFFRRSTTLPLKPHNRFTGVKPIN